MKEKKICINCVDIGDCQCLDCDDFESCEDCKFDEDDLEYCEFFNAGDVSEEEPVKVNQEVIDGLVSIIVNN